MLLLANKQWPNPFVVMIQASGSVTRCRALITEICLCNLPEALQAKVLPTGSTAASYRASK